MANYAYGKIYKIISDQTDEIYIGSTAKRLLSQRMGAHRADYKRWLKGDYHYVSSFELMQYDDAKIILLEAFPCDSKDELAAQEQAWIDQFKDICVNKNKASTGMTMQEYMKEYSKTPKYKAYQNVYKKEKFHCIYCDISGTLQNKARHEKSQKHKDNIEFFESC